MITLVRHDGPGRLSVSILSYHREKKNTDKLRNPGTGEKTIGEIVPTLTFTPVVPYARDPRYAVAVTPNVGTVGAVLALNEGRMEMGFVLNEANPALADYMGPEWRVVGRPDHPFTDERHKIYTLTNPKLIGTVARRLTEEKVWHPWFFDFSGITVMFSYMNDDTHLHTWEIIEPRVAAEIRGEFAKVPPGGEPDANAIGNLATNGLILKLRGKFLSVERNNFRKFAFRHV